MPEKRHITRFGLMRHATTCWNQEKRIQGHADSPLTPFGANQARAWGRMLKARCWDRIVSSDSGRAWQTALLINTYLKLPMESDPRLREQDWGAWTGRTLMQIGRENLEKPTLREDAGWDFCPPGGENREAVWKRSQQALEDMGERCRGESILVVTHEGVVKCLIYGLSGRRFIPSETPCLYPGHLHWLCYKGIILEIEKINAMYLCSEF